MNSECNTWLEVDIKKKLKGFELDIELSAGHGCLGILGPSGCGKSMTLKSIAGIVTPDRGRITLGDRVLYDREKRVNQRPQQRRVGYLFQNYALFPNMTVEENIGAGLSGTYGRKQEEKQRIVASMISRFQLSGLEKRYPGQLSGGQQQRVALARILSYEPEVLLLDEPFSAMDSYLKEGLRLELADIMKNYQGVTIMVTHDRDEAYQLCDNLLLMDHGKLLVGGKTRDVFENPVTCRAARLTGCKNVSRIKRLGEHRILALDWNNLELVTARPVGTDITAVGIRAHDFQPLSQGEAERWKSREEANLIKTEASSVAEMPFEWYITFNNGLWWKKEKNIYTHDAAGVVPEWLRIAPDALLLLKGEL